MVNAMKTNPKAFFAYGRARQNTKARVGPFLDQDTGAPNSDPDYAATVLIDQNSSVFTQPRSEYLVEDVKDIFNGGEIEWRQQHSGRPTLHDFRFTVNDIKMA